VFGSDDRSNAMARTAIPGPLDADAELSEGDSSRLRWPYRAGVAFRHHRPGPLGLGAEPEPGWVHARPSALSIFETIESILTQLDTIAGWTVRIGVSSHEGSQGVSHAGEARTLKDETDLCSGRWPEVGTPTWCL
jgi:hypothetical protein